MEIRYEMERIGHDVISIKSYENRNFFFKIISRIQWLNTLIVNLLIQKKIRKIKRQVDHVFMIRGVYYNSTTLDSLKKQWPNAEFVLYLWDSLKKSNYRINIKKYFDRIYSFDQKDCNKFNFLYLPMYYNPQFEVNEENKTIKYDLIFIGSEKRDRYFVLKKIQEDARRNNLSINIFLRFSYLGFFRKKVFGGKKYRMIKRNDFQFRNISLDEVVQKYQSSRCIIDIENDLQSGLTPRTYEVIALGKKIITTNSDIKNTSFYNKNNVLVIDRKNPKIEPEFINSTKVMYDKKDLYSLEKWLKEIFNHE
ncbi:hypothetical protein [uncultured Draconibacterium sp.]|uniref:hypothetical protein n=1 Tax=uncultured Draconibacterium sp. TaxID=1573823 RepID=UPI00321774F5